MFDRSHAHTHEYFRSNSPEWMTDEAVTTLMKGYLLSDESPNKMYKRIAQAAASYYPSRGLPSIDFSQSDLLNSFEHALLRGWLSPATPVACNMGAGDTGLVCSCNSVYVTNSISGIFDAVKEAAVLTKHGAGLGINLADVIGVSSVVDWALFFDQVAETVSQGKSRRGAIALYISVWHKDIEAFLNAKELLEGDPREKLDCNIAVMIDDEFMLQVYYGNPWAKRIFARILELGMKYGSPYIQFVDNCHEQDPPCYTDKGMNSGSSNLCNEVLLFHDKDHTYACILSSLNLAKYREWQHFKYKGKVTLPELAIYFLDAVNEEYIQRGQLKEGMEKSVRAAQKGRALGLGTLGLHSLYLSEMLPWASPKAYALNIEVHSFIEDEGWKASRTLAKELGEPEWCKGYGIRNTHITACAPTTTNSVLCNAGSPGIEPVVGMYYSMSGAKGTFSRKNRYLEELLQRIGKDNGYTWKSIREHGGSVQHLDFLTDHEKEVFKTAFEIDQEHLVRQAGDRQKHICQGQSFNLFFKNDTPAQTIFDLHVLAHSVGMKGRYYIRSDSQMVETGQTIDYVFLRSRPTCSYCTKAKQLLDEHNIPYREEYKAEGRVPEIWIDGDMLDDGYASLVKLLDSVGVQGGVTQKESECVACEG